MTSAARLLERQHAGSFVALDLADGVMRRSHVHQRKAVRGDEGVDGLRLPVGAGGSELHLEQAFADNGSDDGGAILEAEYEKGGPLQTWSMNSRSTHRYGTITDADATWKIRAAIRKHKREGTLHRHERETFDCPPIS